MTTTIAPGVGQGIDFVQQGPGASPGYAAIDVRRAAQLAMLQGCIGSSVLTAGAYSVAQRGAGANMSVDIAANVGSLLVAGTTIANQSLYVVPPHSAVINETIAAADPTNPRVDQIIVRTYDNAIDSTGNNRAETTVLTGTPTAGATIGIGGNRNGAAALPANAYRLADVLVPAASVSVTNANIFDRRPKTRGHTNISASESRSNTAYGTLTTPDQVTELVLPTDGLIIVEYQATWQESVSGAARAAIFLNATQIQAAINATNAVSAAATNTATAATDRPLFSTPLGLASGTAAAYAGDVTTGQVVGMAGNFAMDLAGVAGYSQLFSGRTEIFANAGTYHVSVQFKASSGSVTAKNRHLWVNMFAPDQAVLG